MSKETNLSVVEIQGVRCYVDKFGAAWINAEDATRGLGFVQIKKDRVPTCGDKSDLLNDGEIINDDNYYTAVRWERINDYLREFGYDKTIGKDDFIPEGVFYMLAMKASNEAAIKFQKRIAFEILPSLRKYGYYAMPGRDEIKSPELNKVTSEKFLKVVKAINNYNRACYDLNAKKKRMYELSKEWLELDKECKALETKKQELIEKVDESMQEFFEMGKRLKVEDRDLVEAIASKEELS